MAVTKIQYKSIIHNGVEYIEIEGRPYPYVEIAKAREERMLQEERENLSNSLNHLREMKMIDDNNNGHLTLEGMIFLEATEKSMGHATRIGG